ncbi:MAG: HAMP domain-containing histidine kinase, partial [Chloroflexi bacterium]|nr:HAMP domain-containing histidine kinase [Chloroflexota bacterium]
GLIVFLVLAGIVTVIVVAIVSWLVIGRALRPLRTLTATVDEIRDTGDLSRRLPDVRTRDEVGMLTASFNAMLERVASAQARQAAALEAQRRFVADASHELRTPLTTIRTNAELLVEHPEVADTDRREAIADIAAEAERMARLTDELLVLARTDAAEPAATTHRPLDLAALVKEVVARAARAAPDGRAVTLEADGAAVVRGDPDLLTRLLWILVDNALRHGAGPVSVTVTADPDAPVTLGVADRGPGIALADRDRLFERFARGDRARSPGGFGLGLPIARAIVEAHGGTIKIEDAPGGGARFVVELPAG